MFANNFGGQKNICCGLVFDAGKRPIPLISVDVSATVIHAVAQVEITQYYVNKEEQPIEAIYYFPVDPDGSVTNFQAELDGRVIKGTVKPRDEALKDYVEAIADKKTSFLGEETAIDIFKLQVGFLKPGAHVKIVIEYMTEVKNEPGTNNIRFYIPTTIAPRYVSSTETDSQAIEIENMQFSSSSPAPLSIKVKVSIQGGIKAIECPTHKVTVQTSKPVSENDNYHKAIVELSGQTTDMDRDFVLTIQPEEKHKPRMYSETNGNDNSTAVMIHLIPSFKLGELKTELIFVLDRSGSMRGRSIALAREALLLILHSLPADCYFNVVGFGSFHTSVFPTSVKYDEENLKKAKAHARALAADMGGTEILAPLKEIFDQPEIDDYFRQIFVLTDGEVSDTNNVLRIVHANAHKVRVFALGIGDAASHGLVGGIAKAGGGTAAYVTYNESVDKKVLDQLKNALQPSLTEIHLEWEGLSPIQEQQTSILNKTKTLLGYNKPIESDELTSDTSPRIKQSPEKIPPVFDGSQLIVFGLFKNDCPKSVLITAQSPDGPLTVRVEHSLSNDHGEDVRLLFHRLAAIRLIRDLEAKEDSERKKSFKQEIIDMACQNGITSRYTSFIAIDVTDKKQMLVNWVMETRYIPNQLAHGWHGGCDVWASYDRADILPAHCTLQAAATNSGFSPTSVIKSKIQSMTNNFFGRSDPKNPQYEQQRRLQALKAQCDEVVYPNSRPNYDEILVGLGPLNEAQRRLQATKAQCDEVVDIMKTNVERVLERDAKLSELDDRCDCLSPKFFVQADGNDAANACSSSLLMSLINLQSYDGSFTLNKELVPILGKSLTEMVEASNKHNLSNQVFATALAISFFVHNLADEREKWDLIVAKARKWLNATVQSENVDRIIELTSEFLKSQ